MTMVFALPRTPEERLSVTFFVALLIHALLIFAVGFDSEKNRYRATTTIEVILVQTSTKTMPEDADYLAQADQEGSGEQKELRRPTTPVPAPFPDLDLAVLSAAVPPELAASQQKPVLEQLTTPLPAKEKISPVERRELRKTPPEQGDSTRTAPLTSSVTAVALIVDARNSVASLQAEMAKTYNAFAKRPKHEFISAASTKSYPYAAYMDDWRAKIERIGNIHYPDEALRKNLSGQLIVDVAINKNGTIYEVNIMKPSEFSVLNNAAIHFVRRAAPFAPFPKHISKETDILHITRTLYFSSSGGVSSR
ncbi:MAG: energy transducer TonB [Gammaproteobacteria bacterium]|nr:energy transducer TonB [Gammaproteobacteria bacterium]